MKYKSIRQLFIGTSGWIYNHWQNIFYPKNLAQKDRLRYFSEYFKTTEINYSFYHLPSPAVYQNWYQQTPENFIFAVKVSRFITHIKRLKNVKQSWKVFLNNALNLKEKLGPFLLQLPPGFKCNAEAIVKFKHFLTLFTECKIQCLKSKNIKLRLAIEVRNSSFDNTEFFNLLKKHKTALVISNSPTWKQIEKTELADFVYVRMHGSKALFSSKYTKKELELLAQKIKKWLKSKDVYVYFNNDVAGYAIENAKTLKNLCKLTNKPTKK